MTERKILKIPKRRLSCTIEEVTPEMAKIWLLNNHENRPIEEHRVREYANKMRCGDWKEKVPDGTPLIVMKGGELINGQHRLMALLKYGKSVRMQVLVYEQKENTIGG